MSSTKKFYLVSEDILPEAILKTALVKEDLAGGRVENVGQAVERAGISRSTFYKYRDGVFIFSDDSSTKIINVSMLLKHEMGVLSRVLYLIAGLGGNVLTINQNLPLRGTANTTMSLDVEHLRVSVDGLLSELMATPGASRVELTGKS
jgi:chorismate mutase